MNKKQNISKYSLKQVTSKISKTKMRILQSLPLDEHNQLDHSIVSLPCISEADLQALFLGSPGA